MTRFMGAPSPTTEPHGACISRLRSYVSTVVCSMEEEEEERCAWMYRWILIGFRSGSGPPEWRLPIPSKLAARRHRPPTPIPLRNRCLGLSAWPSTRVIYLGNVIIRSSTSERPPPFGHRLIKMVQGKGGEGYIDGIRRSEYLDDYF